MACFSNPHLSIPNTRRRVRSYVLRQGRFTAAQRKAMLELWPDYAINFSKTPFDAHSLFESDSPCVVEIGFGDGTSLVEQAKSMPDENFIGIEVHKPGVGQLLRLIQESKLANLKVMNHDAVDIFNHMIVDNSLACIQIFFPDPWHKKRHHKRRLINHTFIDLICKKLQPYGRLHMATDWKDYALQMMRVMESTKGMKNIAGRNNFSDKPLHRPTTRFEKRGQRLGHGVWDLVYQKL